MDWSSFWLVSGVSLAVLLLLQVGTFVWGRRIGKVAVVDIVWGLGFALVGVVALLLGSGDLTRRWLLALLVVAWGLRLTVHIARRSRGKGEDPRYEEMLADSGPGRTFVRVNVAQGVLQWVISLPLQAAAAAGPTQGLWWVVLVLGVLVWAVGLAFETIGDAQLEAFKADPAHRGQVMDRGLWAWTRHPNYFGDSAVWWGLFLVAVSCGEWGAAWTVLSPVLMTHFLRNVSGARLLERSMSTKPGFAAYAERTAYFVPRPPRRSP